MRPQWPDFDLQLFNKQPSGEQTAINNVTQQTNQLDEASLQLIADFTGVALPVIKQMLPMLQATASGQATPMARAAQAPVMQQASRTVGQIGTELGGVTNPNSLIKDINTTATQSAGLAEDSTIGAAIQTIQNLVGTLGNAASTGVGGLGEGLNASTNIAKLVSSQPSPFQQVMGGIGDLAGLYFGLSSGGAFSGAGGGMGSQIDAANQPAWTDVGPQQ